MAYSGPQHSAVATAAARDASNGPEFVARAEQALGAPIKVLSGKQEARQALLDRCEWDDMDGVPTLGVVSRMTSQKGLDLVAALAVAQQAAGETVLLKELPPEPGSSSRDAMPLSD